MDRALGALRQKVMPVADEAVLKNDEDGARRLFAVLESEFLRCNEEKSKYFAFSTWNDAYQIQFLQPMSTGAFDFDVGNIEKRIDEMLSSHWDSVAQHALGYALLLERVSLRFSEIAQTQLYANWENQRKLLTAGFASARDNWHRQQELLAEQKTMRIEQEALDAKLRQTQERFEGTQQEQKRLQDELKQSQDAHKERQRSLQKQISDAQERTEAVRLEMQRQHAQEVQRMQAENECLEARARQAEAAANNAKKKSNNFFAKLFR